MMNQQVLISVEELARQIDSAIVVDCRSDLTDKGLGQKQYEAGHLPRAAHFALHDVLSGPATKSSGRNPLPDPEKLAQHMRSLGANNDSLVVAYDAGPGVYAARLWWLLRWCGHASVCVLDGGYAAWLAAGYPVSTQADVQASGAASFSSSPGSFSLRASLELTVDTEPLHADLGSGKYCIVDARAADRWRGDVEPFDPVAGRIPGALNRPNSTNLRPDGRFKPAEVLRQEWLALLSAPHVQPGVAAAGASEGARVVHSCGSGVSACHNLLSMRLAGLHDGLMLHPGSWSQWCADPSRPVERGGA